MANKQRQGMRPELILRAELGLHHITETGGDSVIDRGSMLSLVVHILERIPDSAVRSHAIYDTLNDAHETAKLRIHEIMRQLSQQCYWVLRQYDHGSALASSGTLSVHNMLLRQMHDGVADERVLHMFGLLLAFGMIDPTQIKSGLANNSNQPHLILLLLTAIKLMMSQQYVQNYYLDKKNLSARGPNDLREYVMRTQRIDRDGQIIDHGMQQGRGTLEQLRDHHTSLIYHIVKDMPIPEEQRQAILSIYHRMNFYDVQVGQFFDAVFFRDKHKNHTLLDLRSLSFDFISYVVQTQIIDNLISVYGESATVDDIIRNDWNSVLELRYQYINGKYFQGLIDIAHVVYPNDKMYELCTVLYKQGGTIFQGVNDMGDWSGFFFDPQKLYRTKSGVDGQADFYNHMLTEPLLCLRELVIDSDKGKSIAKTIAECLKKADMVSDVHTRVALPSDFLSGVASKQIRDLFALSFEDIQNALYSSGIWIYLHNHHHCLRQQHSSQMKEILTNNNSSLTFHQQLGMEILLILTRPVKTISLEAIKKTKITMMLGFNIKKFIAGRYAYDGRNVAIRSDIIQSMPLLVPMHTLVPDNVDTSLPFVQQLRILSQCYFKKDDNIYFNKLLYNNLRLMINTIKNDDPLCVKIAQLVCERYGVDNVDKVQIIYNLLAILKEPDKVDTYDHLLRQMITEYGDVGLSHNSPSLYNIEQFWLLPPDLIVQWCRSFVQDVQDVCSGESADTYGKINELCDAKNIESLKRALIDLCGRLSHNSNHLSIVNDHFRVPLLKKINTPDQLRECDEGGHLYDIFMAQGHPAFLNVSLALIAESQYEQRDDHAANVIAILHNYLSLLIKEDPLLAHQPTYMFESFWELPDSMVLTIFYQYTSTIFQQASQTGTAIHVSYIYNCIKYQFAEQFELASLQDVDAIDDPELLHLFSSLGIIIPAHGSLEGKLGAIFYQLLDILSTQKQQIGFIPSSISSRQVRQWYDFLGSYNSGEGTEAIAHFYFKRAEKYFGSIMLMKNISPLHIDFLKYLFYFIVSWTQESPTQGSRPRSTTQKSISDLVGYLSSYLAKKQPNYVHIYARQLQALQRVETIFMNFSAKFIGRLWHILLKNSDTQFIYNKKNDTISTFIATYYDKLIALWHPQYVTLCQKLLGECIKDYVKKNPGTTSLLDIGCGPGNITQLIIEKLDGADRNLCGIDPSDMIEQFDGRLHKHRYKNNVTTRGIDLFDMDEGNEPYDLAYASLVVHNIPHSASPDSSKKIAFMRKWFDVLKPGGVGILVDIFFHDQRSEGMSISYANLSKHKKKVRKRLKHYNYARDNSFDDLLDAILLKEIIIDLFGGGLITVCEMIEILQIVGFEDIQVVGGTDTNIYCLTFKKPDVQPLL